MQLSPRELAPAYPAAMPPVAGRASPGPAPVGSGYFFPCGVAQLAARRAHNPEVARSNRAAATITIGIVVNPADPANVLMRAAGREGPALRVCCEA